MPLKEALALNNFCHRNGIAFIRADVRGVFASVFTDFGPSFTVADVDGGLRSAACMFGILWLLQGVHVCLMEMC